MITIPADGGAVGGKKVDTSLVYTQHGIIMWTAWFVLGLAMIFTNRWFPYLTNKSNKIHALLGYSIVILTAYAAISMIVVNGFVDVTIHDIEGLIIFFGVFLFAMTGSMTFFVKNTTLFSRFFSADKHLYYQTKIVMTVRRVHKFLALTFWALSIITMTTGLLFYLANLVDPI